MFPSYMSECLPVSLMPDTHFLFRLFCIHMLLYVSIYLSVTFIHTMSPICVCLSLSPSPSDFTSLCRYSMCTIVFVCLVTLVSYACFHINSSYQLTELCRHACQSDCSSTWLSIRFLCIVAHLSALLSSFTFSTYYHHFLS